MAVVAALYRHLLEALAVVAGAMLAAMAFAIVLDVVVRNLGLQPPNFTVSFTEYVLLYTTMLGAPYMVRRKGHILVEALIESVGPALHAVMARFVYLVCTLLSAALTYYGAKLLLQGIASNDMEYRSFDMPRWILDVTLPLGFGFSTIEFLRYLEGEKHIVYLSETGLALPGRVQSERGGSFVGIEARARRAARRTVAAPSVSRPASRIAATDASSFGKTSTAATRTPGDGCRSASTTFPATPSARVAFNPASACRAWSASGERGTGLFRIVSRPAHSW